MNREQFFEIKNLSCRYRHVKAVSELHLSVGKGEIVTLIGNNGSGKSTILNALCSVLPVYAFLNGEIIFQGERIDKLPAHEIVSRRISMVPEGRRIFFHLSVEENLLMGAYHQKLSRRKLNNSLEHVYELFPILLERRHNPGAALSGGQQQMLAIGRALMAEPSFLLLDEPSLGLAPLMVSEIFRIIKQINQSGTTILLVEQNAVLALKTASRAYVLEKGKIALEGSREQLLQNQKVKDIYLGETF